MALIRLKQFFPGILERHVVKDGKFRDSENVRGLASF